MLVFTGLRYLHENNFKICFIRGLKNVFEVEKKRMNNNNSTIRLIIWNENLLSAYISIWIIKTKLLSTKIENIVSLFLNHVK